MARHGAAERADVADAAQRLHALALSRLPPGWVPDPAESADAAAWDDGGGVAWDDGAEREPHQAARSAGWIDAAPRSVPSAGVLLRSWAQDRTPPWARGVVDRVGIGSLAVGAVVVAVLVVLAVHAIRDRPSAGPSYDASVASATSSYRSESVESPQPADTGAAVGGSAGSIVVDVGGRVRKPGLVTLPAGARVADAITAAGGPLHQHELATVDLAARVADGQLLLVGVSSGADPTDPGDGTGDPSSGAPAAPVSLSNATSDELQTLPGVGPVTAQKIIDWRTAHGGFSSVEELQEVSGIGPTRYAELSPLVTP
jgi:competence protein ComEA